MKMDVLVLWKDDTQNVVNSENLVTLSRKKKIIKPGVKVKMYFDNKWFYGTVLDCEYISNESDSSDLSDNQPLSNIVKKQKTDFTQVLEPGQENLPKPETNQGESTSSRPLRVTRCINPSYKVNQGSHSEHSSNEFEDDLEKDPTYSASDLCSNYNCNNSMNYVCTKCSNPICKFHVQLTQDNLYCLICFSPLANKQNKQKENFYSSSDEEPLVKIVAKSHTDTTIRTLTNDIIEDETQKKTCSVYGCVDEISFGCPKCLNLLCWEHFENNNPCENHNEDVMEGLQPEHFEVDGSRREAEDVKGKKKEKTEFRKQQKILKKTGEGYIIDKTMNLVPPRTIQHTTCGGNCLRFGKKCDAFSEEERQNICEAFNKLGNIQLQREYINRYVISQETKMKTTGSAPSRRSSTYLYHLPLKNNKVPVCKQMFNATLCIGEKVVRTALRKMLPVGTIEKDKRGGRHEKLKASDEIVREAIANHINRFPRIESHYCRSDTSREYLHEDLTIPKMYNMYLEVCKDNEKGSIDTYRRVFKQMNLSFHLPKKDQCSLCATYHEGDDIKKATLQTKYDLHIQQKKKVREIKKECKEKAEKDQKFISAVFDLQQVIYLPKTKESAVFYKRRLSVFNFTIYELSSKDCYCFTWSEIESKRGSSEIATCIHRFLVDLDNRNVTSVALFADGCSGQNKNSIIASMLLFTLVHSKNIKEITLRFFEPYHGQSEGDAAHSAISTALSHCGNLFVPSQLHPIIELARRKQPYSVKAMAFSDFLDFKTFSTDLRVLSIRQDEDNKDLKWTEMSEFMVVKDQPTKIFFKNSHLEHSYRNITLMRQQNELAKVKVLQLNHEPKKITTEKFNDLVSLCEGPTPVVRAQEHVLFYKSLKHGNKTVRPTKKTKTKQREIKSSKHRSKSI